MVEICSGSALARSAGGSVAGVGELLSYREGLLEVLSRARPLPAETVPLEQGIGRYLAERALSQVDLPPFASSAMDGFAMRAADSPGRLPVVARIAAGAPATRPLAAGGGKGNG